MRKIRMYLGTGFANCAHEEVVEVDDDTTDEELDEYLHDWAGNYLDLNWSEEEN